MVDDNNKQQLEAMLIPYFNRYQEVMTALDPNMKYMIYTIGDCWWLKSYADIRQTLDIRLGSVIQAMEWFTEKTYQALNFQTSLFLIQPQPMLIDYLPSTKPYLTYQLKPLTEQLDTLVKHSKSPDDTDKYPDYTDKRLVRLGVNGQIISPDIPCTFLATLTTYDEFDRMPTRVYPSEYVDCETISKLYPETPIMVGKHAYLDPERSQQGVYYVLEVQL